MADSRFFRSLGFLDLPCGPGAILCLCREPIPLTEHAQALPIGLI